MVSYFKNQWFNLIAGIACFGMSIYGIYQGNVYSSAMWADAAFVWWIMSVVQYSSDRIELLEKKAEKYDALCNNVSALNEANRVDREYVSLLEARIKKLEERR